jgi:hypothetical protein
MTNWKEEYLWPNLKYYLGICLRGLRITISGYPVLSLGLPKKLSKGANHLATTLGPFCQIQKVTVFPCTIFTALLKYFRFSVSDDARLCVAC